MLQRGAEFLQSIGLAHIENRVRELTTACLTMLKGAGFDVVQLQREPAVMVAKVFV